MNTATPKLNGAGVCALVLAAQANVTYAPPQP